MTEEIEDLEHDDLLDDDEPRSKAGPIAVVALGLLIGVVPGYTVFGQKLAPTLLARELAEPEDDGGGGYGGGGGEESRIATIENLVVNPARSGGSRFLLTSVAIEVNTTEQVAMIDAYRVQLSEALLLVFGAKTTNELADITTRGALVEEVRSTIVGILGPDVVYRVYIPQFVIQ